MNAKTPVTFVSLDKLMEMTENKEPFTLVEVLDAEEYEKGHLPFAASLPAGSIAADAAKVLPDKTRTVVVYCSGYMCHASTNATRELLAMGYARVLDFKAGKGGWVAAGLPLMKGKK